ILDAAAGIFELALAPKFNARQAAFHRAQPHQRRSADEIDHVFDARRDHLPRILLISSTAAIDPETQRSIGVGGLFASSAISSTETPARRKYSAATPLATTRAAISLRWPAPPTSRKRICRE